MLMSKLAEQGEIPQETIRRLARNVVSDARSSGWNEMPFDVELLAELQCIEVKCAEGDIRAEARLMPLPGNRLIIEYAADAPVRRRRFSICHEIAHTLFPDCYERVQHRRNNESFDRVHSELELLCHVGAGEFLMPLEEFLEATNGRLPSLEVAHELGNSFDASQEAALRRMVDLSGDPFCLLWISERLKPTEERNAGPELNLGFAGPSMKLRVDYQFGSPSWKTFVPKHKSIPDGSVLYQTLSDRLPRALSEDWSELDLGRLRVEAMTSMHSEPSARGIMVLLSSHE
ncbi:ImmA/IrrE family metallo-endopeptidase [Roseimicrobium gellanilyticum]|nr:ImmA/IrrE family metallo-endopeptidase [Roseimicrobium gellanilyticum]